LSGLGAAIRNLTDEQPETTIEHLKASLEAQAQSTKMIDGDAASTFHLSDLGVAIKNLTEEQLETMIEHLKASLEAQAQSTEMIDGEAASTF